MPFGWNLYVFLLVLVFHGMSKYKWNVFEFEFDRNSSHSNNDDVDDDDGGAFWCISGMSCETFNDPCPVDYIWFEDVQMCLYQLPDELPWSEARHKCREWNSGAGDLLVGDDDDINKAIKDDSANFE